MFCSSASVADGGDDNDRDGIFQRNALRTSLAAFQNRPANLVVAISAASAAACGAVGDDEEGGSALAVPSSKESSKSCAASRSPPFGLDLDLALERRSADASSTWRDSSSASEPRRSKGNVLPLLVSITASNGAELCVCVFLPMLVAGVC